MAKHHSYPSSETVKRRELDNGLTILVYENFSSETVVVEGLVRAGAIAEPRSKAGLADFTADLLMRGTQRRTFEEIYELLESVGASVSFGGGRHATHFAAQGLVEDLDLMVDLLRESLCGPLFPAEHVERVRGQSITGLQMRKNDTRRMARLAFSELCFGDHPYGQSVSGYLETVPAISRDDLIDFHRTYYGPEGMILVAVGAAKAETLFARLEAAFGGWRNPVQGVLPQPPDAPRPVGILRRDLVMPDKTQCDIVLGLPGPRRSAPDYLDASLMNTILGVFGTMGRIGSNVREKQGLAYYASSRLEGGIGPGPWSAAAGVAPENVEIAIESIRDEVRRIQEELVSDAELADSKAYRIGSLPVGLETNGGLADAISDIYYYGLGLDYLHQLPEFLNSITPERVRAAAQKVLSLDQMAIAVAGPASR